jgi:type IV pilus assembly protein PilV
MKIAQASRRQTKTLGFTLIETMVALLVLSVGMLGIAALHGQALSASGIAINRSLAVGLAGNMADRIRANRSAGAAYAGGASDNACDDTETGIDCSPAEMAAHDLFLWAAELDAALPGGAGTVAVDSGVNPVRYTVTVGWDEPSQNVPVTFVIEFQLQAY